jgi:hypothetical protein
MSLCNFEFKLLKTTHLNFETCIHFIFIPTYFEFGILQNFLVLYLSFYIMFYYYMTHVKICSINILNLILIWSHSCSWKKYILMQKKLLE